MPYSNPCDSAKIEYAGDGSTVLYTFPFEYTKQSDVKVYLWNDNQYELNTGWTFENATTIRFNTAPAASTNPVGQNVIRIVRETDIEPLSAQFYPGSSIKAKDLNDNFEQLKFAVEENRCIADSDYWKKYEGTIHSNETWSSSDDLIATTASLDATFLRQDSSETISSGVPWSNSDNYVATTAAIDARVVDLVEEVGGFVPIDNETSFPEENPDINNGDGTLISIKEITTDRGIGGGTVTITNGAGSNTVTITGVPATGMLAGYGAIVETTSTLHTYTFHRLSPPAVEVTTVANNIANVNTTATNIANVNTVSSISSDVTTVAGITSDVTTIAGSITNVNNVATNISSVNDFAARYRVSASEPTTSLDDGDLWWDTTSDTLKVYEATSGNWVIGVTNTNGFLPIAGGTMTGSLNVITGTAAAPGIAFDSDPDTGAYRTGANGLGFSTGGTGRLFIDSSGNVGVGTSTPNYLLDVEKADAGARINALTGNSSVYLTCSDNAGISTLFLGDAASPTIGQIKYRNSGDSLAFEVNGSERLRVTSSGNVGIGTSTVNSKLVVQGSDGGNVLHLHGSTGTASRGLRFGLAAGTATNDIGVYDAITSTGQHSFRIAGTEAVRIDSSGNVGVGLTPTAKFHVAGTIQSSVGSHTAQMYSDGGASFFTSVGAYPSVFYTNGSERLRIDSSGRVGIGNSSPTQELCVRSTAGTEADILLEGDNGASGGLTVFHNASDCGLWNSSNTSMRFATNGTERLRIGPAGQFGLSGANYGTSGQVLTSNGSASAPTWQTPSDDAYAIFQHTTTSGTDGGATSIGTWNVRPINTTAISQTWASISSNQITLSAGTYSIEWRGVIYRSGDTQSRFRNVTDSTTAVLGVSLHSNDSGGGGGFGKVTIASSKTFELQHYTSGNDAGGFGRDAGSGENNVFATIKITKHA